MIGERENFLDETQYGSLILHPYNILENDIDAFYDSSDNLVFVLDKTITANKPNVLLVINPDADKKWDEILSGKYDVDLETIRPKQDNKYQKLDIEYSGLSVYENLINAYNAGDGLDECINQLNILRDSAARHSAMMRLNVANDTIAKTNATIVKTKESIVRFRERLKTLRSKLADMKKEVGKIPTKKSAAKILRTESQIESTNEKLKRAQKRLESAEKRLEIAKVDAELASNLLNEPSQEIKQITKNKPVVIAPNHEIQTTTDDDFDDLDELDDSDEEETVKPLFDKDPNIIDENIAFKPISFDNVLPVSEPEPILPAPVTQSETIEEENTLAPVFEPMPEPETRPVLESITPVVEEPFVPEYYEEAPTKTDFGSAVPVVDTSKLESAEFAIPESFEAPTAKEMSEQNQDVPEVPVSPVPVDDSVRPVPPVIGVGTNAPVNKLPDYKDKKQKSTFLYYTLLLLLIALSVLALWMYQKNIGNKKFGLSVVTAPIEDSVSQKDTQKTVDSKDTVAEETVEKVTVKQEVPAEEEDLFVDTEENKLEEKTVEEEPKTADVEPLIINDVSASVSAVKIPENEEFVEEEEDVISPQPVVNKPVYGAGSKHDAMFVYEEDQDFEDEVEIEPEYQQPVLEDQSQSIIYTPEQQVASEVYTEEQQSGFIDDGEVIYDGYEDDIFYDEDYDPEEAAYQAGDDGYAEYK